MKTLEEIQIEYKTTVNIVKNAYLAKLFNTIWNFFLLHLEARDKRIEELEELQTIHLEIIENLKKKPKYNTISANTDNAKLVESVFKE